MMPKLIDTQAVYTVAYFYNDEDDPFPVKTAAEKLGVCTRTIHRYVKRARELGVITRQSPCHARRNPLVHGTVHGYQAWGCRCQPCRDANAKHFDTQRRRRLNKAEIPDSVVHGRHCYTNWGCRCTVCSADHAQMLKENREDRLSRPQDIPHGTPSGYAAWGCEEDCCKPLYLKQRRDYRAKVQAES